MSRCRVGSSYPKRVLVGAPSHYDVIKGETPVNAYKMLSPGTPVPQALLDAQARSDQLAGTSGDDTTNSGRTNNPPPANPSVTTTTTGGEHVGTVTSADTIGCGPPPGNNGACDPSWFKANACTDAQAANAPFATSGDSTLWPWCIYNNWGNRQTTSGTNFDSGYGATCASIGSHLFSLSSDSGGGGQWTVSQGTWRWESPGSNCGYFVWGLLP